MSRIRNQQLLALGLWVVAFYAIPVGIAAIPVGLFVGSHIFVTALVHLVLGAGAAIGAWRLTQKTSN